MSEQLRNNRRDFLKKAGILTGGLLIGFHLNGSARPDDKPTAAAPPPPSTNPNAFLHIAPDGAVTVICAYAEMGQGVYTAIAQLIGEELSMDWNKVKVTAAPVAEVYNHLVYHCQMTGGSSSVTSEYERMRQVGATARTMLVAAAAANWGVQPADCTAKNSIITHTASGKKASYGDLAEAAMKMPAPDAKTLKLKSRKEFNLIGKSPKRVDIVSKTNGTAIYGIDISLPGMLVAVIQRCPAGLGKVASYDDSKAKAIPGVIAVVDMGNGVAVVADGYWNAKKGRDLLQIKWNRGEHEGFSTKNEMEQYRKDVQKPGILAMKKGDVTQKIAGGKAYDVEYEFPYLASACMEPLNCVADVKENSCDIYVGTQGQTFDLYGCAGALKMAPAQISIHTQLNGGGFGRRCQMDAHMVVEAAILSKIMKTSVKVIWSREDDMRGGYYRLANYHKLQVQTDAAGHPQSWYHRLAMPSFVLGTPFEGPLVKNGVDYFQLDGAIELPYEIPNLQVEWVKEKMTVPGIWQRANSHFYNPYIKETMIDVLAKDARKNPYEYRLELLKGNARHTAVLKMVAQKAGWGKPLPAGHAMGMALHENFGSVMGSMLELSLTPDGGIKVYRVVSVIDCGIAINPSVIEAQIQGCTIWAISQALYGEINIENGEVLEGNFHEFKVARMMHTPRMETHIMPSEAPIGGIGEASVGCIAPAMANALLALTGHQFTKMPFPARIKKSA